jgi:hypothetical protein
MISVDTANTEQEGNHQRRSMMDNVERISSSNPKGVESTGEYLTPLKDTSTSKDQENKVNGLQQKAATPTTFTNGGGDNGSVSSTGNTFDIFKPHDLPPIVETRSGGPGDMDFETDCQNGMLSPSFDDQDMEETYDSFPATTNENKFSIPSVKDVIRMFGGSAKVRTNYRNKVVVTEETEGSLMKNENNQHQYRSSSMSSTGSAASRRTDVPMAKRHGRDDDSSLGDYSISSMPAFAEPMHSPEWNKTRSELDMLREQSIVSSRRRLQARSAARKDRLKYKLTEGRKGMTEKDLNLSRTFLPADKMIELKHEQKVHSATSQQSELYVWLISPTNKIFEVVRVPYDGNDTTIGEVLVLARGAALDPVLAEQRYVSLCNDKLELVAPMLPVSFLFHQSHLKTGTGGATANQSLMAVPEGWTAFVIREIQKVLMGNRRVKKWLKQKDIFRPLSEEEKSRRRAERHRRKHHSND